LIRAPKSPARHVPAGLFYVRGKLALPCAALKNIGATGIPGEKKRPDGMGRFLYEDRRRNGSGELSCISAQE